ncbi:MAG: hypothetical protein M1831_003870 [Alyxoria varia]|nr:MAG: hypothetical protein M1831_003870 [Alyxoria varia]
MVRYKQTRRNRRTPHIAGPRKLKLSTADNRGSDGAKKTGGSGSGREQPAKSADDFEGSKGGVEKDAMDVAQGGAMGKRERPASKDEKHHHPPAASKGKIKKVKAANNTAISPASATPSQTTKTAEFKALIAQIADAEGKMSALKAAVGLYGREDGGEGGECGSGNGVAEGSRKRDGSGREKKGDGEIAQAIGKGERTSASSDVKMVDVDSDSDSDVEIIPFASKKRGPVDTSDNDIMFPIKAKTKIPSNNKLKKTHARDNHAPPATAVGPEKSDKIPVPPYGSSPSESQNKREKDPHKHTTQVQVQVQSQDKHPSNTHKNEEARRTRYWLYTPKAWPYPNSVTARKFAAEHHGAEDSAGSAEAPTKKLPLPQQIGGSKPDHNEKREKLRKAVRKKHRAEDRLQELGESEQGWCPRHIASAREMDAEALEEANKEIEEALKATGDCKEQWGPVMKSVLEELEGSEKGAIAEKMRQITKRKLGKGQKGGPKKRMKKKQRGELWRDTFVAEMTSSHSSNNAVKPNGTKYAHHSEQLERPDGTNEEPSHSHILSEHEPTPKYNGGIKRRSSNNVRNNSRDVAAKRLKPDHNPTEGSESEAESNSSESSDVSIAGEQDPTAESHDESEGYEDIDDVPTEGGTEATFIEEVEIFKHRILERSQRYRGPESKLMVNFLLESLGKLPHG